MFGEVCKFNVENSVFLVRHGETEWNLAHRFQGQLDSPLTERGRKQAEQLASFLATAQLRRIFSSPLDRALQTAQIIQRQTNCQLEIDERLEEISFGLCAGLTREELERIHPGLWDSREENKWNFRWFRGESYADVYRRVGGFVADNVADLLKGGVAIVAHETLNKLLIGKLLGLPRQEILRLRHPHGVIIHLQVAKRNKEIEHIDIRKPRRLGELDLCIERRRTVEAVSWSEIRFLLLDCDGVLTDGGIYYVSNGEEFRRFNVKDGTGIRRLVDSGVGVGIVSASSATPILHRARQLGIDEVHVSVEGKARLVKRIAEHRNLSLSSIAYMGDDLADIAVLQIVGFPLAVADAVEEVRRLALYVTSVGGGQGAVREVADLILAAQSEQV